MENVRIFYKVGTLGKCAEKNIGVLSFEAQKHEKVRLKHATTTRYCRESHVLVQLIDDIHRRT
jgi:hypothetical protein